MPPVLFPEERHRRILSLLAERERLSVQELSSQFGLSAATIRADLVRLSQQGLLVRTHGGAIRLNVTEAELPFDTRRQMHPAEKDQIGAAAAALVEDGEAIFLDASTTSLAIAAHLKDRHDLVVVTNGLAVAQELLHAPGLTVLMPGGMARADTLSLVGFVGGGEALRGVHLSKAFVGARGFTPENGLMDASPLEVAARRELLRLAERLIAVVDGSKWGVLSAVVFAKTEQIHTLVTDVSAPADMVAEVRSRKIGVILAERKSA